MDDARLAEIFAREVLAFLVGKELVSSEWAERLLSWQHTGFSVHSLVRAKTKPEAERVGKYMIRLLLFLVSAVANDIIVGLMGITLAEKRGLRSDCRDPRCRKLRRVATHPLR
ncbi:MAG: hypothetical protein MUQ00_11070 [Candidatus Aminicenantes bacterium]|nr:hypothetical protein [Candidatus Aminicenantes bacterium]